MIVGTCYQFPYKETTRGNASHFLYKSLSGRRLLLPLEVELSEKGLRFFGITPLIRLLTFLRFPFRPRKYVRLIHPEGSPMADWSCQTAIYIGADGPYQKYSILNMRTRSEMGVVAKLALSAAPGKLLENEANILGQLKEIDAINRCVPELVTQGTSGNATWLVQQAGLGSAYGKYTDLRPAIDFLKLLARKTEVIESYFDSNCRRKVLARADRVFDKLSPIWQARCKLGIAYLDEMADKSQSMVIAHRDFTRWNIKFVAGRIFVFDWEYAEKGYPALYDILHFILMPHAARGHIQTAAIDNAFKAAASITCSPANVQQLRWQLLFYMLDLCMLYLESNDGSDLGDKVVQSYAVVIDNILGKVTK